MSYSIAVSKRVASELSSLPRNIIIRIDQQIAQLADNPRPPGSRKLKGKFQEGYRVRAGDYRILYVIDDANHAVVVYRVGHRRSVYD